MRCFILTRMDEPAQSICEIVIRGSGHPGAHSCCKFCASADAIRPINRLSPNRLANVEDRCPSGAGYDPSFANQLAASSEGCS